MSLTDLHTILAFKAGRAVRREGTNTVEPSLTKGAIVVEREHDDLLHFMWKNRETNETEEVCKIPSKSWHMYGALSCFAQS